MSNKEEFSRQLVFVGKGIELDLTRDVQSKILNAC